MLKCVLAATFVVALGWLVPLAASGQEDKIESLLQRAAQADQRREFDAAIKLLDEVIATNPKLADPYYRRGRANFCAGKIAQSMADFDKYVALKPDAESRQWERGIAYYYAGE
ncbi:MAG: hypothetical protein L0211_26310, partial [Planctomycetaceae bacterium]|nr:hypothetical protein [Planctomycetaceae bacterium]